MEDITILMTSIIAILVSSGVGVVGIMAVYEDYPELSGLPEPTCVCEEIKAEYDRPRQVASALGFLIGSPVILGWWIITRLNIGRTPEIK